MAFPKNTDSARGRELQAKLTAAGSDWMDWPEPTTDDYVLIGKLVVVYNYIDFSLRRLAETFDGAGLLTGSWKGKSAGLTMADAAAAMQSVPVWEGPHDMEALVAIEDHRRVRNLFAHCAIRRFPDEDAFAFFIKSARDFKRQFGSEPEPGMAMNVSMDCKEARQTLKQALYLQQWLAQATASFETKLPPSKI